MSRRALASVFVLLLAGACAQTALPPQESPAAEEVEPTLAPEAVEPGFTYCCGDEEFRLEIDCSEMLKRCYQFDGGAWRQTYGRHCQQGLGEGCYLEACESSC